MKVKKSNKKILKINNKIISKDFTAKIAIIKFQISKNLNDLYSLQQLKIAIFAQKF